MANDYGRAEGGERLKMPKPMDRGNSYSIIGAIGLGGIIGMLYGQIKVCGAAFLEFIKKELLPKIGHKHVIFLDNASIHKSDSIREAIEAKGAKLVFLPPYSPELSPIENMWSKMKSTIRKLMPRDPEAFHDALVQAISELSDNDFEEWYEHCGYDLKS